MPMIASLFLQLVALLVMGGERGAIIKRRKLLSVSKEQQSQHQQQQYKSVSTTVTVPVPVTGRTININNSDNRRAAIHTFMRALLASTLTLTKAESSNAACLSGDTSPSCIGVYKLPLDDNVLKYIDTPEHLLKYAPDLHWVPPTLSPVTYDQAKQQLTTIYKNNILIQIPQMVTKGNLIDAGVDILSIVPAVTLSGRFIIHHLLNNHNDNDNDNDSTSISHTQLRVRDLESALNQLLADLGQLDVMIGQSIQGQLGSITVAQIQILQLLNDVQHDFSAFINTIP